MKTVIFDLDGTLCDIEHRRHLVEGAEKPDWRAFYDACHLDAPKPDIIALTWIFHAAGHQVVILSGREDSVHDKTLAWLADNGVYFDHIMMRPTGNYEPDQELKRRMLAAIRASGGQPWLVVDDRDKVVAMWRAEGLTCLQCAPGAF